MESFDERVVVPGTELLPQPVWLYPPPHYALDCVRVVTYDSEILVPVAALPALSELLLRIHAFYETPKGGDA